MRDRKDGRLVKIDSDPFHLIVSCIMPKRTEAEVSVTQEFDVTKLLKTLEKY